MIKVNEDWCKGCGICIERCPVSALEESDTMNKRGIHPPRLKAVNECNDCRLCELLCPDLAIIIFPEEKKKHEKKMLLRPVGGRNK